MNKDLSQADITDVTDTALWVAAYRAQESKRADALFNDPFADLLIGNMGELIALKTQGSRYTAWSVVIRTLIIDEFIENLLSKNIDTVVNLGAGLDTRPYRLNMNSDLRWIEVDFPKIIDLKNEKLKEAQPKCHLERLSLDLSDENIRDQFLNDVARTSNNVLVITEGVVPYLSNDDAHSLVSALKKHEQFKFWITEYYSPEILKFLRTPKRLDQMKNAPFLFYPENWFMFFKERGWNEVTTKFFGIESRKHGRTPPTPGWLKSSGLNQNEIEETIKKYLGYSIYQNEN